MTTPEQDFIADIYAAIERVKSSGPPPDTICYMIPYEARPHAVKGNAKQRKLARFKNKATFRKYILGHPALSYFADQILK